MTPRLLGYGIDTLVVNLYWAEGKYALPEGLEATLDQLKELYRVNPEGAVFWGVDAYFPLPNPALDPVAGELRLFEAALVQPVRHYPWQLSFGGLVFVRLSAVRDTTRRANFPAVRVEVTGRYMMYAGRDAQRVVQWVVDAATNLVGVAPERVQVSRVDLFADVEVEAGTFRLQDLDRFTSRSRVRGLYSVGGAAHGLQAGAAPAEGGLMSNTPPATSVRVPDAWEDGPETASAYLRGREWSGFVFGRGPLMARVYSKSLEAKVKPASRVLLRMYEETEGPITGEVVRVEFQLTPEVLREMVVEGDGSDLRDWDTFCWALSAVWSYLTGSWLVLRDVGNYQNAWHAPVDPVWEVVQSAFVEGAGAGKGKVVRYKLFMVHDGLALAKQALGAFMTALGAVQRLGKVDLRSWWIGAFRALGRDMEERAFLAREAAFAYRSAYERKMARFGFLPEEMAYGGV